MEDVVKKRIIGAVALIIIGVSLPVVITRCMNDSATGDQAMRVYKITPDGGVEQVGAPDDDAGQGDAQAADQAHPPAGETGQQAAREQAEQGTDGASPNQTGDSPSAGGHTANAQSGATEADTGAENAQPETGGEPEPEPQAGQPAPDSESEPQPGAQPETEAEAQSTAESGNAGAADMMREVEAGAWVIQVASFRKESNARALVRTLNEHFPVYYTRARIEGKTWYRVRVGPLDNEAAAMNKSSALRAQGYNTLVLQTE